MKILKQRCEAILLMMILGALTLGAQNIGLQIEGTGFGAQQRITDTVSGNSLVFQSGEAANLKVTGYNYNTGAAQPLYIGVDGADTHINSGGGRLFIGQTTRPTSVYAATIEGDYGVYGAALGLGVAIFGHNLSTEGGYAGYFNGATHINGRLTKSSGAFMIDHPLDPQNKYLLHSFVESPDMKNIYDGVVTTDAQGLAEVVLPEWFETLNMDFRYQLTCVGQYAENYISKEIRNNRFEITSSKPFTKISWMVTGIRNDPYARDHRIQVEKDKSGEDVGTYLYPKGYDKSEDYLAPLLKSARSQ
ncbi:MAG: hypothetical protein KDC53_08610 [Saprospiraceae bacterium]|nr:hypothetical protein [Saprospiraceae bacterium]